MASPASLSASVPTTQDFNAKLDVRAQALQGQIQDWSTCPTTDPATKRQIVSRLSAELATVYAEDSKVTEARHTGVGQNLDLVA